MTGNAVNGIRSLRERQQERYASFLAMIPLARPLKYFLISDRVGKGFHVEYITRQPGR
jgi:hypothetical protein